LVYLRGEEQKFGEKAKVVFQDGRVLQREKTWGREKERQNQGASNASTAA
jgi:hypothetical protein